MSYEQAAGLFITYPTSYEGLVGRGEVKKGDWVLVHAGAGGVGLAAVQIAKGRYYRGAIGSVIRRKLTLSTSPFHPCVCFLHT
jgi:NADPH:quinone reductase-like Zn-dependent oxidoreductase